MPLTPEEEADIQTGDTASPEQNEEFDDTFGAASGTPEEREAAAKEAAESDKADETPAEEDGAKADEEAKAAEAKKAADEEAAAKAAAEAEADGSPDIAALEKSVEDAEGDEAKAEAQKALDEAKGKAEDEVTAADRAKAEAAKLREDRQKQQYESFLDAIEKQRPNVRETVKDEKFLLWLSRQPTRIQQQASQGNQADAIEVLDMWDKAQQDGTTEQAASGTPKIDGAFLDTLNDVAVPVHEDDGPATFKALRDEYGDALVSGLLAGTMKATQGLIDGAMERISQLEGREYLKPEDMAPVKQQLAEVQLYRELGKMGHTDAEQIEASDEYKAFVKDDDGLNDLANSYNPKHVKLAMDAFKEHKAKQSKSETDKEKGAKHKRRLDLHSETVAGGGRRTPTDQGEQTGDFDGAWDEAAAKATA